MHVHVHMQAVTVHVICILPWLRQFLLLYKYYVHWSVFTKTFVACMFMINIFFVFFAIFFGRDMLTIHVLPFFQNCFRNSINIWTVLNHQSSLLVKSKKMANSPSWMFYYQKKMMVVSQHRFTGSPHTLTTIFTSVHTIHSLVNNR